MVTKTQPGLCTLLPLLLGICEGPAGSLPADRVNAQPVLWLSSPGVNLLGPRGSSGYTFCVGDRQETKH